MMNDNGTYIQVPNVGSQISMITVFGDHRVNIERTIRSIMALVGLPTVFEFHEADNNVPLGLSILHCVLLVITRDIRRFDAPGDSQSRSDAADTQAHITCHGL